MKEGVQAFPNKRGPSTRMVNLGSSMGNPAGGSRRGAQWGTDCNVSLGQPSRAALVPNNIS